MFPKVITIIAVTVAVFILTAHWKTPDPSRGESHDGITIPLTKRSDTDAREFSNLSLTTSHDGEIIHGPSDMDGSERNTGTAHPFAVKRNGPGAGIYLRKAIDSDAIWYGSILIGTPPKLFTVQLNTGTSDLIIPKSTGDENCRSHSHVWDPTSSLFNLDLQSSFGLRFADGRIACGGQYMDNVTIAGFTADHQTIGAATIYSLGMRASYFTPDGVLGLAFRPHSGFQGQSPLLYTLFNERKLHSPVFALKLTDPGGELFLGGTNTALYVQSTLVYTPVTSPLVWQLNIDNIQVNNRIVLTNVLAVIDTGANFVYGDPNRVFEMHQAAGGAPYGLERVGYYTFPCKYFPTVTFTIGGRPFSIPSAVLNKGRTESRSRRCFSGIVVPFEDFPCWSIGTIFLELFYTVFDFSQSPRIGLAELQRNA